jgi:hypothetical protein
MKGFVIYRCRKDGTPYEGTTWTFHPFTGNDAYWEDVCLANERRTETDRSGRFANLRDRVRRGLGDTIPADALAELFWYGSPSFVSVRSLSDSSAILTLTFGADMRMADGSPYYRVRYDITDSPLPEESEDDAKNGD